MIWRSQHFLTRPCSFQNTNALFLLTQCQCHPENGVRVSDRAMIITVTLICAYFAAWDATKKHGVEYPKFETGPVGRNGFQTATMHSVGEDAPMPFLIRLKADGDPSEFFVWFFGLKFKLPFTTSPAMGNSNTRGIEEPPRMVEAILAQVPVGTPVDDAQRFMEREGFKCSRSTNAAFLDRTGLDYVYCDRWEASGFVKRRWQVAIVHRDGKVTEVLASTGLVGP